MTTQPTLSRIVLLVRDLPSALSFFHAAGLTALSRADVTAGAAAVLLTGGPGTPRLVLVESVSETPIESSPRAILSLAVAPGSLAALVPALLIRGGAVLEGRIEYRPGGAVATVSTPAVPGTWIALEEPEEEVEEAAKAKAKNSETLR